jgi:hypothetical protein
MTTTSFAQRQPSKLDYASPTQFKFNIVKLPKVEYFCTAVNLPGVSIGTTEQSTPLRNVPLPGEKLTFEDLTMTFMVDENLINYQEIHGWLIGLGFPQSHTQYKNLTDAGADRAPTSASSVSTEPGKVKYGPGSQIGGFSDATLIVLSAKNRPVTEVRFTDLFPTSLSSLNYNQQEEDVNYLTANVTFKYSIYEFGTNINSSTTSVTTS